MWEVSLSTPTTLIGSPAPRGDGGSSVSQLELVPEIDVLIAAALWLWQKEARPIQFSVATGQGIDSRADRDRLERALDLAGVPKQPRSFISHGPDIIALSRDQLWQVESKGAGAGVGSTQRNNFDRAVASVVSYYRDSGISDFPNATPTLGLALPATQAYRQLLRTRLPDALRKRLNLWLLLYQANSSTIQAVEPDQPLP